MLKAVLFDLGNVLIHFSHTRAFAQIAKLCNESPAIIKDFLNEQSQNGSLHWQYESGLLSTDDLHNRFSQQFTCQVSRPAFEHAISDIFWPNPIMEQCLAAVKNAGVRTVLVSNTNPAHVNFIQNHYDFWQWIDVAILSHEVGVCKPDPKIYDIALAAAECSAEDCLFVDDLLVNCNGAELAGISAFHFRNDDFRAPTRLYEAFAGRGLHLPAAHLPPLTRQRASVAVIHQGKLLTVRLRDAATRATASYLPGGKVESGETPAEAAARECLEESGYRIQVDTNSAIVSRYLFTWEGRSYDCTTHFFRGTLISETPQPVDDAPYHQGVHWIALEEVPRHFDFHKEIFASLRKLLKIPE